VKPGNGASGNIANIGQDVPSAAARAQSAPEENTGENHLPKAARNIVVESGSFPLDPDDEPEVATADSIAGQQQDLEVIPDDEPTLTDVPDLINDTHPDLEALADFEPVARPVESSEENFDLDAVLSPDTESTNVMPGLTGRLDDIANSANSANFVPVATPNPTELAAGTLENAPAGRDAQSCKPDDLPTLSSDMQIEPKPAAGQNDLKGADDRAPVMHDPLLDNAQGIPEADLTALQAVLDSVKSEELASKGFGITGNTAGVDTPDQVIQKQQPTSDEVMADAIGRADSLEDFSDGMAATLFGEEFSEAAAAAFSMGEEAAKGEPAEPGQPDAEAPVADQAEAQNEEFSLPTTTPVPEMAETKTQVPDINVPEGEGLRESVAMRIDVLNRMKSLADSERTETVELGEDPPVEVTPRPTGPQPEPIERQINTSMTQALEALSTAKVGNNVANDEDVTADEDDDKSGGFFSKFRRSS
jgi:hypothetical protein